MDAMVTQAEVLRRERGARKYERQLAWADRDEARRRLWRNRLRAAWAELLDGLFGHKYRDDDLAWCREGYTGTTDQKCVRCRCNLTDTHWRKNGPHVPFRQLEFGGTGPLGRPKPARLIGWALHFGGFKVARVQWRDVVTGRLICPKVRLASQERRWIQRSVDAAKHTKQMCRATARNLGHDPDDPETVKAMPFGMSEAARPRRR